MTPVSVLAVPPPPPSANRIGSDDPDEITSWVSRRDGDHSRVVHGTGPYGFQLARIETSVVQIAWASTRLANTLRARFRQPTFHVPLGGVQRYVYGRRGVEAAMGRLVFIASGTEVTRHSDGDPVVAIEIDASTFESEFRSRRGSDRTERPRVPQTLDLAEPQQREVTEAIAALVHAHLPGAAATARIHGESRVLSALAGTLTWSVGDGAAPLAIQRLKHLEDWIDAHVSEAITLGRLCEVAQIGERSLQLAFHARRSMSPMRFVCERRLAAAQRRLFRAGPDEDVTAIATSLGFTHLGRFASAYCAAFGESPSRTLARGRRSIQVRSTAAPTRDGGGQ
jgi:AraC-like DNA-binding protein